MYIVFLLLHLNQFFINYKFTTLMNKKKDNRTQPFITFGPNNHQQGNQIEIQQKNQYSSSTSEKLDQSKNEQSNSLKKQTNHEDNLHILYKIPISPIKAISQPKQASLSSFGISYDMTPLLIQDKIQVVNEEHCQQIVLIKKQNSHHIHQSNSTIQHLGCCNIFYKKNWHFKQLAIKIQDNKHPLLCIQLIQLPIDNLVKAKIILNEEGQQPKEGLIKLTFQKQQSEKEKKQEQIIFISAKRSRQRGIITDQFAVFANIIHYKLIGSNIGNSDWNKTPHIDNNIILNSYMFGSIYKKGQIRDQWNSRYAVIRDDGFYSFHSNTESKYSFKIQAKDIKQIWTRFDQIYDSVIFKIRHGLSKTELALPICKYSKDQCSNWLLQLYRIANKTF